MPPDDVNKLSNRTEELSSLFPLYIRYIYLNGPFYHFTKIKIWVIYMNIYGHTIQVDSFDLGTC